MSFILLITISNSFGQTPQLVNNKSKVELSCTYRITFRLDSTSTNVLTENMQLLIANDLSEFRSVNLFKQDSLKNATLSRPDVNSMSSGEMTLAVNEVLKAPRSKFTYLIYKVPSKKRCVVYDKILNVEYKYEEPAELFHWKLTADKASVAGYTCQKATTAFAGRNYEAWFTREIPFSDGPYKFNGLPGLIVKINDTNNDYVFELVRLRKPTKEYTINLPTQPAIPTTKAEFFPAVKTARETAIDRASQYGMTFNNPQEIRAKVRERMKHENNPIELKY